MGKEKELWEKWKEAQKKREETRRRLRRTRDVVEKRAARFEEACALAEEIRVEWDKAYNKKK